MLNLNLIPLLLTFLLLSPLSLCSAETQELDDESPFHYVEGTEKGPHKWGLLNSTWKVCESGKFQSPIDIVDQRVQLFPKLGKLNRNYEPALAEIINRGHDISVKWKGDAGKININGSEYKLQQCHWHSPSEHTINGAKYDMEMHAVHTTSAGQIAVISVLYKFGPPDPFLEKVVPHLKTVGEKGMDFGTVDPRDIIVGAKKYYRYIGSLTVPPCTEGVTWTIVKKVRTVSWEQVKALRDAVHDGFHQNARPVQDLHGRLVYLYNPTN